MMMYRQLDGQITLEDRFEGYGYSGTNEGRDNPDYEDVPSVGPIPRGSYHIGPAHDHPKLGPVVFDLTPNPGTETFGRSAFRIHGDNLKSDASHGCIVAGHTLRMRIKALGETELLVM